MNIVVSLASNFFISILCMHGCATIHYLKRDPVDYLAKFFSMKNFIPTR